MDDVSPSQGGKKGEAAGYDQPGIGGMDCTPVSNLGTEHQFHTSMLVQVSEFRGSQGAVLT